VALGDAIKGAASILPEVPKPTRQPSLNEKFIWTAIALVMFLVMSEIPLYGVGGLGQNTSPTALRVIFASTQGSLMELGIGPIVTAGLISQLLVGSELIRLDFSKTEDRSTFSAFNKVFTFLFIVGEAGLYVFSGYLQGPNGAALTLVATVVVTIQLVAASIVVFLLDQMVQKGWGIGSGISLFIMAGVAQKFMLDLFSPFPSPQYYGFFPYLINATAHGDFSLLLYRGSFPGLISLVATLGVILIIVYLEGVRIEIPVTSQKYKGFSGVYPIKLLYVSNIPVILVGALIANLQFFSLLLYSRFNSSSTSGIINAIAYYAPANATLGQTAPQLKGGLLYYISSPGSLIAAASDPVRILTYLVFWVIFSVLFAKLWVELGGMSADKAAKSLLDAQVQVPGFRSTTSTVKIVLQKYIPAVTILGGIIVGLLASVSDILGVFGSGIGLLLMIDIILQYYQMLLKEQVESLMPRLGGLIAR
jgi:preprotein translocase SecY subunit